MKYLFVFLLFGLVSCGDGESSKNNSSKGDLKVTNEWPEDLQKERISLCKEMRKTLMTNVSEDKWEKYCRCNLDKIMSKCPEPNDAETLSIKEIQEIGLDCAGEIGISIK